VTLATVAQIFPYLTHHRRESCIFLLFAAQVVVAEITPGSSYLTGGIRYGNGHVATYYTQLVSLSLSLSLLWSNSLFWWKPTTDCDTGKSHSPTFVIISQCLHQGARTLQARASFSSPHYQPIHPALLLNDPTPAINLKQYH